MTDLVQRIKIRQQVAGCRGCELVESSSGPVCFSGGERGPVSLVVIGEAPGKVEDTLGQPFVGSAGRVLRRGLDKVGIDPENVGMLNVVSCYPDGTPTRGQIASCRGNMEGQLDYLDPEFVVVLGNTALGVFWPKLRIGEMRGKWWWEETLTGRKRWVTATYHPAAILRDRNMWETFLGDLAAVKWRMEGGAELFGEEEGSGCVRCGKGAVRERRGIGACKGHVSVIGYGRDRVSLF